jgi:hypothetical protein
MNHRLFPSNCLGSPNAAGRTTERTTDVLEVGQQFSAVTLEAITRALNERGVHPERE